MMTAAPGKRTPPRPTLELGDTIRESREARHLSIQAAAAEAGISQGYQFKLESGFVRTPSPRILHRLGRVLELPYAELMRLAGYARDSDVTASAVAPPETARTAAAAARQEVDTTGNSAPTNRRILRLLEEIRRDVAAVREDVRRLETTQRRAG
jgi:transcriptional regulator with XRE-family HTH domain